MYNYSIESTEIIWHTTNDWQQAIDEWSRTRLGLTCDDVAIYVSRNGEFIVRLENKEDIKNHSDFLLAVRDASNRVEGRIMMDMYEQEVSGMEVVEPKDKLDLLTEWQEPYAAYMMRKTKEETNYGIELPLTDDLSDTTIDLDFHGNFEDMDDDAQDAIINPKHYKIIPAGSYPNGLEYMDICEYALAHLHGVKSHLLGQILKYTFRVGKKDAFLQDAKKIAWYANRLVAVIEGKVNNTDNSALINDVTNALEAVNTASQYMHETGDVEDSQLDYAHEGIVSAIDILNSFLERKRNEGKS